MPKPLVHLRPIRDGSGLGGGRGVETPLVCIPFLDEHGTRGTPFSSAAKKAAIHTSLQRSRKKRMGCMSGHGHSGTLKRKGEEEAKRAARSVFSAGERKEEEEQRWVYCDRGEIHQSWCSFCSFRRASF